MPRRTLKARRAKRSASRKRQGGCFGRACKRFKRFFGYDSNNENEEAKMYREANEYQMKRVMNAAAATKKETEEARALYGPETRGATRRAYEKALDNARADGITPSGFFRRF